MSGVDEVLSSLNQAVKALSPDSPGELGKRSVTKGAGEGVDVSKVSDAASSSFSKSETMLQALKDVSTALEGQEYLPENEITEIDVALQKAEEASESAPYDQQPVIKSKIREIRATIQELKSPSSVSLGNVPTRADLPEKEVSSSLSKSNASLQASAKSQLEDRPELLEDYKEVNDKLTRLEDEIGSLTYLIDEDKKIIEDQNKKKEKLESEIHSLQAASNNLENTIKTVEDQINNLNNKINQINKTPKRKSLFKSRKKQIQEKSKTIKNLTENLTKLKKEVTEENLEKKRAQLQKTVENIIKFEENLKTRESNLENKRKELLISKIKDNGSKIKNINAELKSIKKNLKTIESEQKQKELWAKESQLQDQAKKLSKDTEFFEIALFQLTSGNTEFPSNRTISSTMKILQDDASKELKDSYTETLVRGQIRPGFIGVLLAGKDSHMSKNDERTIDLTIDGEKTAITTTTEARRDITRASFWVDGQEVITDNDNKFNEKAVIPKNVNDAYEAIVTELLRKKVPLDNINQTLKFLVQTVTTDCALHLYNEIFMDEFNKATERGESPPRPVDRSVSYDVIIEDNRIVGFEARVLTEFQPDSENETPNDYYISVTRVRFEQEDGSINYSEGDAELLTYKLEKNVK